MTKICTNCNIEKPLDQFHKETKGKYGVRSGCKSCAAIWHSVYRRENKEKLRLYSVNWCEKNKTKKRKQNLGVKIRNRYGSVEGYEALKKLKQAIKELSNA
jgi:hypothetical protein